MDKKPVDIYELMDDEDAKYQFLEDFEEALAISMWDEDEFVEAMDEFLEIVTVQGEGVGDNE